MVARACLSSNADSPVRSPNHHPWRIKCFWIKNVPYQGWEPPSLSRIFSFQKFLSPPLPIFPPKERPPANKRQKAKDGFYFIYFFIFQINFFPTLFRSFWEGFILVATKTNAHSHPQRASQIQLRKNHHSFKGNQFHAAPSGVFSSQVLMLP